MSWSLRVTGSKEAVKAEVEKLEYAPEGVRAAICDAVDNADVSEGYVVFVDTNGHTGKGAHQQDAHFTVSAVKLVADD